MTGRPFSLAGLPDEVVPASSRGVVTRRPIGQGGRERGSRCQRYRRVRIDQPRLRIRWLLPFENPGPSTSMACKPWSAMQVELGFAGDYRWVTLVRQRRLLPESRQSPARNQAEVCPRSPGIHPRGNVRTPLAYWPPAASALGNLPNADGRRPGAGKTRRTASRSIERSSVRSRATIASDSLVLDRIGATP